MPGYDNPKSRNKSMNAGPMKDTKVNVGNEGMVTSAAKTVTTKSKSAMKGPKGFQGGLVDGMVG